MGKPVGRSATLASGQADRCRRVASRWLQCADFGSMPVAGLRAPDRGRLGFQSLHLRLQTAALLAERRQQVRHLAAVPARPAAVPLLEELVRERAELVVGHLRGFPGEQVEHSARELLLHQRANALGHVPAHGVVDVHAGEHPETADLGGPADVVEVLGHALRGVEAADAFVQAARHEDAHPEALGLEDLHQLVEGVAELVDGPVDGLGAVDGPDPRDADVHEILFEPSQNPGEESIGQHDIRVEEHQVFTACSRGAAVASRRGRPPPDHPNAVAAGDGPGAVAGAVVRDDDFPVGVVLALDAREEAREEILLVERRHDDAQHGSPPAPAAGIWTKALPSATFSAERRRSAPRLPPGRAAAPPGAVPKR